MLRHLLFALGIAGCSSSNNHTTQSHDAALPDARVPDAQPVATADASLSSIDATVPTDGSIATDGNAPLHVPDAGKVGTGPGSLIGSQVTFSVHCCFAPAGDDNLKSTPTTMTIGPDVEYPAIRQLGAMVINADVDVAANYIRVTYREDFTAYDGTFDGYQFAFPTADEGPHIVSATVSPQSDVPTGAATVTWNAGTGKLLVDIAGLAGTTSTTLYIALEVTE
ncbi:MAG TPA: hypothetical protein VH062_23065 [Polyangiaceae bacterium]|jgi:hypothetical protein|nr:hypothetical protein [Polyangiaceae bacterium]